MKVGCTPAYLSPLLLMLCASTLSLTRSQIDKVLLIQLGTLQLAYWLQTFGRLRWLTCSKPTPQQHGGQYLFRGPQYKAEQAQSFSSNRCSLDMHERHCPNS